MTSQQQNTTVNQEKRQNGHSTQKYERRNQQNRKHFTKQRKFVPREKQNYRNGGQRHTNESRTIYIGKIFNRDLEGTSISDQLIKQRINSLKDIIHNLGRVEALSYDANTSHMLVTFENREQASAALKKLRNREECEALMSKTKEKLTQLKLPESTCPTLHYYRYEWSDRPAQPKGAKNAYVSKPKQVQAKTVVAEEKKPQTQPPKKPKQKKEKKQKSVAKPKQQEEQTENPPADVDDLRRVAEKAKLQDEITYLIQQQAQVRNGLEAERNRCQARETRIARLSEELQRVELEKQSLERSLSAEQQLKKLGEERIAKLEEELAHLIQEQTTVENRLQLQQQHPDLLNQHLAQQISKSQKVTQKPQQQQQNTQNWAQAMNAL